ncbi:MAG: hypothetical protein ACREAB_15770 [Blastocatellia bacterium]
MTNPDDITLKSEIAELKSQLADALNRLSRSEGAIEQLNRSISAGNRMTNWQFIGFVVVMAGTLFGTLYWATGVTERRIDQFERNVNSRFEQMEKNNKERADDLKQRFDDLKQVVLSKR